MRTLIPCTSCQRHAWSTEAACPFCGGTLGAPAPRRTVERSLGRAGIVLATSLALAGCSSGKPQVDGPSDPVTHDPPAEPGDPADPVEQQPPDVVAMYGAPAPDPADVAPPEPPDEGSMAPEYGAPMPPPEDTPQ